ncbi:MAG: polysaccharide pyruvyl transferase family protein, partial [Burkholderiales bacterium]
MNRDYYVVLTGSKSNAGDFLIKHRGIGLLRRLRRDRKVVDYNAWEPLDEPKLDVVNGAAALILLGGPALQADMYPAIYPLVEDLSRIRVPLLTMGIGWRSASGDWEAAQRLRLTPQTQSLLRRTAEGRREISVRDYHTLEVLRSNGFRHARMTGCPALYDPDTIGRTPGPPERIARVGISLGVSFLWSAGMRRQMEELVLRSCELFKDAQVEVLFHHPVEPWFLQTHNAPALYYRGHLDFKAWLEGRHVAWRDLSGSAEKLIEYYRSCDLHIGYRVHAHIFMSSIGKPSLLLAEDGRGVALKEVIGGLVFT